ncbi:hypothetical protein AXK12_01540 [Cephaloticoccus capnophilus]|uniref:TonB C-terminal domain-containing protein n=1 Tax=Cephaloticoccus capnophilus TaxID=1548208 RepID=A0A139SSU0_9BACT|nr:energy transducer TonB [Cephaloticoccus capnophilus]KXU37648.1 hypothetical protein AXK12_01540 [Cephaloticoccus capnophilus]
MSPVTRQNLESCGLPSVTARELEGCANEGELTGSHLGCGGRRPSFWARYGVAGVIALGLHAALVVLWPEPSAQPLSHGNGGLREAFAGVGETMELSLIDDDDSLFGEVAEQSPSLQEQRPMQEDWVVAWDFDPSTFTQEVAPDVSGLLAASLAGQMDDAVSAALRAMQESLGQSGGRRGQGLSFGKSGILYAPNPPYPPAARREGREGMVELLVLVDGRGRAKRAEVSRSSGYDDFDETARNTVMTRWQFPARENELQIVRVVFTLTDKTRPSTPASRRAGPTVASAR